MPHGHTRRAPALVRARPRESLSLTRCRGGNRFAQNPYISEHPRLHALPIGLANRAVAHGDTAAVDRLRRGLRDGEKRGWLYVNLDARTSLDRRRALEVLEGQEWVTFAQRRSFEEYLTVLSAHRFVLCPAGNGLDTHR